MTRHFNASHQLGKTKSGSYCDTQSSFDVQEISIAY